jgi:hypothetical protein
VKKRLRVSVGWKRLKREERALRERIADFDASDQLSRDDVHRRGA